MCIAGHTINLEQAIGFKPSNNFELTPVSYAEIIIRGEYILSDIQASTSVYIKAQQLADISLNDSIEYDANTQTLSIDEGEELPNINVDSVSFSADIKGTVSIIELGRMQFGLTALHVLKDPNPAQDSPVLFNLSNPSEYVHLSLPDRPLLKALSTSHEQKLNINLGKTNKSVNVISTTMRSVSGGHVARVSDIDSKVRFAQPGDSGSPIYDGKGKLLGVLSTGFGDSGRGTVSPLISIVTN